MEGEIWTIHEDRLAAGVGMHIKIRHDFMLVSFLNFFHHIAKVIWLGHQLLVWRAEQSVDVSPNKLASCIANGHTICIDHRNNFEDALFPQGIGYLVFAQDKLDDPVNYP